MPHKFNPNNIDLNSLEYFHVKFDEDGLADELVEFVKAYNSLPGKMIVGWLISWVNEDFIYFKYTARFYIK